MLKLPASLALCVALAASPALAAEEPDATDAPLTAATFAGLELRSIGPAVKSGRIADVVLDPEDRGTWYVAVASGGVWKTANAGTTWTPIFDREGSYSIGCVTLDPNNSQVVWVGTGENNSQRSAGYGDGVYRSRDGGESWDNAGLGQSEHIGKIAVDPRDSSVVYVAAQGPLWSPGGDRGLYKSTDGGETWDAVLEISENTGVTDVVFDPRNPDVLYAASFQRRRRQWALVAGGPESAIYKSTDAGATWRKLTRGLPSGVDVGRIGLAVSPHDPDIVYATIAATRDASGFYRSENRGESWRKISDYVPIDPQYYMEIFPDPHRFERLYQFDVFMQVSEDGGHTWNPLGNEFKHVDHHALAFDPEDPDYLLSGTDGGLYETWDRGKTWKHVSNLSITQFYRVGIDNDFPFYNVYGGTQDNDSIGGPSRTTTTHGIRNSDWFITIGGDGYQTRVDPEDPNVLYSMWQYGHLVRYDKKNGETVDIQPQPGPDEEPLTWNWDAPFILSPHSPTRLYFAGNRLFRSDDRGDTWRAISDNLTRGIDRNKLEVMGRVWSVDAVWKNVFTSFYGNATALDESPVAEGLIYAGTDDGLVHVTEDGGENWRRVERFPGVPENTLVADLTASRHSADTVYALFNNHKSGDFSAYVLKSTDRGRTWKSITGDVPERHVAWSLVEDHVNADLLFLGTEFGLFFTLEGGGTWTQLTGGVPTVAFRDLEIQQRENDLVAASFGRGFFILDDYTPLRHSSREVLEREAVLFPVRKTWMYLPGSPIGWGEKDVRGHEFFTAPNPPFGAVFTYSLKEPLETRRQKRYAAEDAVKKEGGDVFYPSWDELRAEAHEEEPAVILTVSDEDGHVVRRLTGPVTAGFHRVAWDLRLPGVRPIRADSEGRRWDDVGPMALPGHYTVSLTRRVDSVDTPLGEPQTFEAVPLGIASLPAPDRKVLLAFHRKAARLQRAVLGAAEVVEETSARLAALRRAVLNTAGAGRSLAGSVRDFEVRLEKIERRLSGDRLVDQGREPRSPSIRERLGRAVAAHWTSSSAATTTHQREYELAAQGFAEVLGELRQLVEVDLVQLERQLDEAGAPWTPGRGVPEWQPE